MNTYELTQVLFNLALLLLGAFLIYKSYGYNKNSEKTAATLSSLTGLILIILVSGTAFMAAGKNSEIEKEQPITTTNVNPLSRTEEVDAAVRSSIVLPIEELPEIKNVEDFGMEFGDNEFLKKAKQDDLILIYQKNTKAIIFRESTNKVIDIAPIVSS